MALEIRKVTRSDDVREFHELPKRLHAGLESWVPPFRLDIERIFDRSNNPFFEAGECERFLVLDGRSVVGRFALMINQEKDELYDPPTGGLGFLELENDQGVMDEIVAFASGWHRERGRGAFRGPVNFGENDNWWGLLVENFDEPPIYGMHYHPPWYRELVERSGARKLDDHWSYKLSLTDPLPERLVRITERIERRPDVELRPIDLKRAYRDAEAIREIYNDAWSNQDIVERESEFTELTSETVRRMVDRLRRVMIPESVLIAFVKGEPASFIVCVPDLNEISAGTGGELRWWHIPRVLRFRKWATRIRTVAFGTKPKFRKMGLEALVFIRGVQMTIRKVPSLKTLEGAWISEKNWLMQRSLEALGCRHHKTHRTYLWTPDELQPSQDG